MHRTLLARRVATVAFGTTLSIAAVGGSAWACPGADTDHGNTSAPHQIWTTPQPASTADFSGHGANVHGPYDSTRDGSASAKALAGIALQTVYADCTVDEGCIHTRTTDVHNSTDTHGQPNSR